MELKEIGFEGPISLSLFIDAKYFHLGEDSSTEQELWEF